MSVLVVTGTGTGVGKTVATAALASAARQAGVDVAVCKPVQTGTADGDDDLADIARLSGITELHGGWRYPESLAPVAAARRAGMALPNRSDLADFAAGCDVPGRLTLVEGAGGLLVALGSDSATLRDLAVDLTAPVLVVVTAGLGTLNHTALTLEALAGRAVPCAGLVVGAWPSTPGPAELSNLDPLAGMAPVRAVIPAGAGSLPAEDFGSMACEVFEAEWISGLC